MTNDTWLYQCAKKRSEAVPSDQHALYPTPSHPPTLSRTDRSRQLLLTTGIVLGVLQLVVFPHAIELVGIVRWQRGGWLLGVISFVLVPNTKELSWNSPSLFAVGVMGDLLVNCAVSAVRKGDRQID